MYIQRLGSLESHRRLRALLRSFRKWAWFPNSSCGGCQQRVSVWDGAISLCMLLTRASIRRAVTQSDRYKKK